MSVSKAQQKATAKYCKNNYDTIVVRFKKGDLDIVKASAELKGKSVNSYITDLVLADSLKIR